MRRAVLVFVVACVALVVAAHALARRSSTYGHAGAQLVIGANVYEFGSPKGSCERIGGDFSVSIPMDGGGYFHLVMTPKDHGAFRSVVWRYSRHDHGVLIQPTLELGRNAQGQTTGTFSGRSTSGILTTGNFTCV